MNKNKIIARVINKLAKNDHIELDNEMTKHTQKVKEMAKKYQKLTPENAIEYARIWEKYHGYKVPANPKTKKIREQGTTVIDVELEGSDNWYPVWYSDHLKGLYGEY